MNLVVRFKGRPADESLILQGAIRTNDLAGTVVDNVRIRVGIGSRFQLTSGAYVYVFHVERGGGKFTLELDGVHPPAANFDPSLQGGYGLTYFFRVDT
jgi:hypothetical protein